MPFLAGFVLIAVALWVRLRVEESPVFKEVQRRQTVVKLPVVEAVKRYPRSVLVGIGAHVCDTAAAYMFATFTVAYAIDELGMTQGRRARRGRHLRCARDRHAAALGALSDRIGRRPLNLFGVIFTGLWAFPFFALVQTGEPVLVWVALIVAAVVGWAPMIAVQPAFYAELFGARVRYTGFATSRELGAAVAGFSPLIAAWLLATTAAAVARGGVLRGLSLITLVAFLFSRETKDVDIGEADPAQEEIVAPAA